MKLCTTKFSVASHHFFPLGYRFSLQHTVLKHPESYYFVSARDQISHSYKITGKIIALYILIFRFLGNFSESSFNFTGIFRSCSFFMAANVRKAVAEGRSDCVPIFLSEIPLLFHRKIVKPDVAFVQVSMIIILTCLCLQTEVFFCA